MALTLTPNIAPACSRVMGSRANVCILLVLSPPCPRFAVSEAMATRCVNLICLRVVRLSLTAWARASFGVPMKVLKSVSLSL